MAHGPDFRPFAPRVRHRTTQRIAAALVGACAALAGLVAATTTPAVAESPGTSITFPYSCTTTAVGGVSYTGNPVQVTVTDTMNAPGVHAYPGGPLTVQLQVDAVVDPAAMSAALGVGTTDWTSTNARIVWGGAASPPSSLTWHLEAVPQFSERFPITFTTAPFQVPGPGDVSPGPISWDFQANPGVQPGFESGHTSCTPIAPVQQYGTFLAAGGPSCAHDGLVWTCRFSYTGAPQLWQVPDDVTEVTVEARGASGATNRPNIDVDKTWPGGRGGMSVATVGVTPGERLAVTAGGVNGFNGGGAGRFDDPGGGASDVRRAPFTLSDRLVVAGGGGGGGYDVFCFSGCRDDSGGAGGGVSGVGAGGGPGTQTAGGAPQPPVDPFVVPEPGSFGSGGNGGAGGGGGYYGGGGSSSSQNTAEVGGGGGGSGFVPPGPDNSTVAGVNSGDGTVAITYTSTTTPYTSRYAPAETSWLLRDALFLHRPDLSGTQHDTAMFMVFLAALIEGQHTTPAPLGSTPGTGASTVTSLYTEAENAQLLHAAALFGSDPPTLQRLGAGLMAYLLALSG